MLYGGYRGGRENDSTGFLQKQQTKKRLCGVRSVKNAIIGSWRITEMELWNQEDIDMMAPGYFRFDASGMGELGFIAVQGELDCRYGTRDGKTAVEFSWEGTDEMDPRSGRGWAVLDGDRLIGRLFFHMGDDSGFAAERQTKERIAKGN